MIDPSFLERPMRATSVGPLSRRLHTLALALVLGGCTDRTEPALVEIPRGADHFLTGLSTHLFSSGRRSLRVDGEEAYVYTDSSTVWIFGVSATSFGPDGMVASILHADSARLDQRAGELTVWGSVVLQDQTGNRRLETDHLTYQAELDRFHTESEFVFRESGRVTEARCFESDATLADWRSCQ